MVRARIKSSLSSPQLLMPKSFADSDWRTPGLRVADLNKSNSTSQGRNSVLESSSSSCSVLDLESILNLSQATARIEREVKANQFVGTTVSNWTFSYSSDKIKDFSTPSHNFFQSFEFYNITKRDFQHNCSQTSASPACRIGSISSQARLRHSSCWELNFSSITAP